MNREETEESEEYEEFEDEETEESEDLGETEDCDCKNFGNMDYMRMFIKSLDLSDRCDDCDCYEECFELTYRETEESKASLKREDEELHIQTFLNNLPDKKLNVDFTFSKTRKLVKTGQLSYGITIPKILNQIFPKRSEVLTFYSVEGKTLLFFGVDSFVSQQNKERLKNLFLKGYATFRNVAFTKLNILLIPTQFLQYFNVNTKVIPQFDSSANVLFLRSNLTDIELEKLERIKQEKGYMVHSSVVKTDSKHLSYKDSREYKQMEKMKKGEST